MKPIELTQEQKDKLLEMCKVLFPEYKYITLGISYRICNGWSNDKLILDKDYLSKDCIVIHWFEFCVRILTPKILSYGIEQLGSECLDNNKNPIDYLYEEFKKKLN